MRRDVVAASTGRTVVLGAAIGALIVALALLIGPISDASAYKKPAKGGWSVEDLFGDVKGGSMKVAKDRKKIKKLKIKISDERAATCGGKVATAKGLKIKRYGKAGGRYAYGKLPKKTGLFEPKPTKFKLGGKKVRAKLMLLFDESGKLAVTARFEYRDCTLNFLVRK
jgi:hypothetical protein